MGAVADLTVENEALSEAVETLQNIIKQQEEYISEIEDENNSLMDTVRRQRKFIDGLKLNNSKLTLERKQLLEKLEDYKNMGLWEFANTLSPEEQRRAGHQFAQQLLGGK